MEKTKKMEAMRVEACKLHDDTNQTYGKYMYSEHITRVFNEALSHLELLGIDSDDIETYEAIMFGAAFHDSIEDARLTYNDVMKVALKYMDEDYAYMATEIVYALTNEKGRNRKERANDRYYQGIRETPYAGFVKMCDRMANYKFSKEEESRMVKVYEKEMPDFLVEIGFDVDVDEW